MSTRDDTATANLVWEVTESRDVRGEWVVEAINSESEGEIYAALFSGQGARERAQEYAAWKNSGQGWMPTR